MLDLILFLKSVPLFREMSFEDIARIAGKTETVAVRVAADRPPYSPPRHNCSVAALR